ncbi:MAG: DUF1343 domain-containing protein [Tissierellia bacterium]|nr:DUF1343 domain-containing protein [Tissierellia bacterium]
MKRKILPLLALLLAFPLPVLGASLRGIRSPQGLYVNDEAVSLRGYNVNDNNYYRLRDLAKILRGQVDFALEGMGDEITLYRNVPYTSFGGDEGAVSREVTGAVGVKELTVVDGDISQRVPVSTFNVADFNYVKLRDIAPYLGIRVAYDGEKNRALIYTSKGEETPPAPQDEEGQEELPLGQTVLGNERIFSDYNHLIRGKKLGLITNQTGVDRDGVPMAQRLKDYPEAELVALYAPEHGVDGKQKAGVYVESYFDEALGLPVYSLYGKTRKPSREMLEGIDVLLYDMQDIGSRTYTYISTLQNAMVAARENGIPIVVLDRPNPLGGEKVEGFLRESRFKSFVGIDKLPMGHGMTVGELAQFFNREIKGDLTVVPMKNWSRKMIYQDTGLTFTQTSPNIPDLESAFMYMATGSGENTGIGSSEYFHWVGGKDIDGEEFAQRLNAFGLEGVTFVPADKKTRGGVRLKITDHHSFNPAKAGYVILATANQMRPINVPELKKPWDMFYLIQGSETMADLLRAQASPQEIIDAYQDDVAAFRAQREAYLLYK